GAAMTPSPHNPSPHNTPRPTLVNPYLEVMQSSHRHPETALRQKRLSRILSGIRQQSQPARAQSFFSAHETPLGRKPVRLDHVHVGHSVRTRVHPATNRQSDSIEDARFATLVRL